MDIYLDLAAGAIVINEYKGISVRVKTTAPDKHTVIATDTDSGKNITVRHFRDRDKAIKYALAFLWTPPAGESI